MAQAHASEVKTLRAEAAAALQRSQEQHQREIAALESDLEAKAMAASAHETELTTIRNLLSQSAAAERENRYASSTPATLLHFLHTMRFSSLRRL